VGASDRLLSESVAITLYWVRGGVFLLFLAVRLIALGSDPPSWLSWSTGLYTDEGFYTLDARHLALFGTQAPGDFHDRLLSPLLTLGMVQARLLSVLFGMMTIAAFWLGLRNAHGQPTADIGALFLGLAPSFVFYNRTALQETPTVFWLTLAFLFWACAGKCNRGRQSVFFALAGASIGIAIVFKSLALLAVPALLAGKGRPNPQYWGLGAIVILYGALWYGPHWAELSHMTTYYRVHQIQPHSLYSLWLNIRRGLFKGEHGVIPYLLATLLVPSLLVIWAVRRKREWSANDRFLAYWLAGGVLFCLLSSYAPSRYYVLFLPALTGLAAFELSKMRILAQRTVIGLFFVTSTVWYGVSWDQRSESISEAAKQLVQILPPGSVVIGDFAPSVCMNTPFASTTVQPGLANDDHPVERLNATDIMVVRNAKNWQEWWRGHYPEIMQPSHRVATFHFGGTRNYLVDLYRVEIKP